MPFFKRSPQAYSIDNVRNAAEGWRTPPDWWHQLRRSEQQAKRQADRVERQTAPRSTAEILQAVAGDQTASISDAVRALPASTRTSFWGAVAECSAAIQEVASEANAAAETSALAREVQRMNTQEATFAQRVRELMETKRISQQELADRVGCSQPAISQMLNRSCRPQKKTILKIAEALQVQAQDLWPDIDVAEMLDAVASFQQSDYVMTEAEALALSDTSRTTRPRIQAKLLPTRRR
jgi:transcriptional regulator with XRE-family HTH domain